MATEIGAADFVVQIFISLVRFIRNFKQENTALWNKEKLTSKFVNLEFLTEPPVGEITQIKNSTESCLDHIIRYLTSFPFINTRADKSPTKQSNLLNFKSTMKILNKVAN